eukprot:262564-Rhodomonas_salina.3
MKGTAYFRHLSPQGVQCSGLEGERGWASLGSCLLHSKQHSTPTVWCSNARISQIRDFNPTGSLHPQFSKRTLSNPSSPFPIQACTLHPQNANP